MRHTICLAAALSAATCVLQACDRRAPLGPEPTLALDSVQPRQAAAKPSPDACAITRSDFTLQSLNAYFPLTVGNQWFLRGEEDGAPIELRVSVLADTEQVGGITTRVVEEREWESGELIEVSRNFFAVTSEGTVCYFGEDVDIYENGVVVSHEGAWRADAPGNSPGIFMPADPRPGMKFTIEGAPGVAEDEGQIVGVGQVEVPAGTFSETIRVREFNPLDGGKDYKVFAKGVGIIVDGPLVLESYQVSP